MPGTFKEAWEEAIRKNKEIAEKTPYGEVDPWSKVERLRDVYLGSPDISASEKLNYIESIKPEYEGRIQRGEDIEKKQEEARKSRGLENIYNPPQKYVPSGKPGETFKKTVQQVAGKPTEFYTKGEQATQLAGVDMNDINSVQNAVNKITALGGNAKPYQERLKYLQTMERAKLTPAYQKMAANVMPIIEKYGGKWNDKYNVFTNIKNISAQLDEGKRIEFNKEITGIINKPAPAPEKQYTAWEGIIDKRAKRIAQKYKLSDTDVQSMDATDINALAMLFQKKGLGPEAATAYLKDMKDLEALTEEGYRRIESGESLGELLSKPYQKPDFPAEQPTEGQEIPSLPGMKYGGKSAKTVVRTGTEKGSKRKVVQYSDGTVVYAQ